jgi:putative ATP-grasp target RiPP
LTSSVGLQRAPCPQPLAPPVKPFALNYARPAVLPPVTAPYTYNRSRQWNVLPDGRPAISDRALLLAVGTTTSTAGSKTHFDD